MNVGAASETDYGLYFAWGETEGYTADQISGTATPHKAFAWSDYDLTEDGGSTMSKYNATDGKTVLDLEDDAVAANWGGSWKMPTETQFKELLNTANCTNVWTTVDGVNGRLFTSVRNGNTLFIPAAGVCSNGSVEDVGNGSNYWSSSLRTNNRQLAYDLYFDSDDAYWDDCNGRYFGCSVRPVVGLEFSGGGGGGDTPSKTLWKLELIESWCYGEYKDGNAFVAGPDENNIYDTNEQGEILKTEELAFIQSYIKDRLSEYFSDIQTVSVVIQTGLSVGDDVPNWEDYELLTT